MEREVEAIHNYVMSWSVNSFNSPQCRVVLFSISALASTDVSETFDLCILSSFVIDVANRPDEMYTVSTYNTMDAAIAATKALYILIIQYRGRLSKMLS